MVKSSNKSKEPATPASPSTGPASAAPTTPDATNSAPPKAKSTARRTGASPAKTSASRKPRAAAAAKPRKNRAARPVVISDDDIRLRAFFISEKRVQSGLPGDSAHDWLEAHRQLQEEAGKSA